MSLTTSRPEMTTDASSAAYYAKELCVRSMQIMVDGTLDQFEERRPPRRGQPRGQGRAARDTWPRPGGVLRHRPVAAQLVRRARLRGPRRRRRRRPRGHPQHDVRPAHGCGHDLRRRRRCRAGDAANRQAVRHDADPLVPGHATASLSSTGPTATTRERRCSSAGSRRRSATWRRCGGPRAVPAAPRPPAHVGPERTAMRVPSRRSRARSTSTRQLARGGPVVSRGTSVGVVSTSSDVR